ncbi:MAG: pyruvate dehydrogenase complex dihydrolipoamide acetyltransferase [Gemmatimonadota bacterium]
MATKIVMAQLSPTMEEGKLVEWKVKEGDQVEAGDILAEVETDKANMDIEALHGGVVRALLVADGDVVAVGALIGVIADADEDISALLESAPSPSSAPADEDAPPPQPEAPSEPAPAEPEPAPAPTDAPTTNVQTPRTSERIKVSPVARRMAQAAGLDLAVMSGTGPGGRIIKGDVEAAIATGATPAAVAPGTTADAPRAMTPVGTPRLEDQRIELSLMRKAIAKRLVQSIGPIPHFFLTTEIDMGRALDMRKSLNDRLSEGKVGVNDLLIKVVAEALTRHPEINASFEGDAIRRHGSVDIGIAVAVPDGLITPVLRDADRKGLVQISVESADLVARGRIRRLTPEEYQGATFTISNLGMLGIDEFTAIINPPEAAILAIGQTVEKPVVEDGEVVVRRRMRVTMSCDHRVIDGAMGAAFLQTLRAMLENPLELVS